MNYLAHAFGFLDRPYFVAGVAIPDWLSFVDRRVRVRSKAASVLHDDVDHRVSELVAGIMQHHHDDAWFHQTQRFAEISMQFAIELRDRLPGDDGFRPSFLGHILVELLLDSELMARHPGLVDRYYDALAGVSPHLVQDTVNRIAKRPTFRLAAMIPRFLSERFLCDYANDEKLFYRLGQIMQRVRLPRLPLSLLPWLADARQQVGSVSDQLLSCTGFPETQLISPSRFLNHSYPSVS